MWKHLIERMRIDMLEMIAVGMAVDMFYRIKAQIVEKVKRT